MKNENLKNQKKIFKKKLKKILKLLGKESFFHLKINQVP
jgi:hypothetical protein